MIRNLIRLIVALFITLSAATVYGRVLVVGGDIFFEYKTLQEAIDAARPGDTIRILWTDPVQSSFYEHITIDKPITIVGSGDGQPMVFYDINRRHGDGASEIIDIRLDDRAEGEVVLKNIRLKNSDPFREADLRPNDAVNLRDAVGIHISSLGNATCRIENCHITSCRTAIFIESAGPVTVQHCRIGTRHVAEWYPVKDKGSIHGGNFFGVVVQDTDEHTSGDIIIRDNMIIRNRFYGVFLTGQRSVLLQNNLIGWNGVRKIPPGQSGYGTGGIVYIRRKGIPSGQIIVDNNIIVGNAGCQVGTRQEDARGVEQNTPVFTYRDNVITSGNTVPGGWDQYRERIRALR